MIHKKIKVIAKIENNTQNLFFINMLYSLIDSRYGPETVENIEDNRLLDNIIDLSYMTIKRFPNHICYRNSIIMYDSQNENYYYYGYKMDDRLYTKIKLPGMVGLAFNPSTWPSINYCYMYIHMYS